jgi:rhomboid protease GluP
MSDSSVQPFEQILRLCEGAAPNPWYPSAYAKAAGISRDSLDPLLDQLRMGGLIQLTDWVQGNGQGYLLTPAGTQVLATPRYLDRLRNGEVPALGIRLPGKEDLRNRGSTTWDRGEAAREAILGQDAVPLVTYSLIIINILVFLAGSVLARQRNVPLDRYFSGNGTEEVRRIQDDIGFLSGEAVYLKNQWLRLLTCCFGHVGWVHLLVNMYSLFAVGPLLERMWGRARYLILYLLAGFGGSCGMLLDNPVAGGAGASGALWGILASMATWLYLNRRFLPPTLIAVWTRQLLICFVLNVFITFSIAHISKGGHFGGGLVGLIAAVPLDLIRFGRGVKRWLAWAGLVAIPVLSLILVLFSFHYTGGMIKRQKLIEDVRDFYKRELIPLERGNFKGPDADQWQRIFEELGKKRSALRQSMEQIDKEDPIWWNPSLENSRKRTKEDLKGLLFEMPRRLNGKSFP